MSDYKDKIRKLLALAKDNSAEGEAEAAMLKARELMAKHKLTEADFADAEQREVAEVMSVVDFSVRRRPWVSPLASVIAERFCCISYTESLRGSTVYTLGFLGFKDDAELCKTVFEYAVECVEERNARMQKERKGEPTARLKMLGNSYGYGFVIGMNDAFKKQSEKNQDWGLVMVVPKEAEEKAKSWGESIPINHDTSGLSAEHFASGYNDGMEFDSRRRMEAAG